MGNVEGMPVMALDRSGVSMPQSRPYMGPQVKPHKSTGICIGKNTIPLIPKECPNRKGITMPRAMNKPDKTILLVLCLNFIDPST